MARKKEFDPDKALKKALNLFWQQGYEATSMQDLTQTMGLSRSSLYDTFGDKRQLFLQALLVYREYHLQRMEQLFAQTDDVKAQFHALFEQAIKESSTDDTRKGCFMINTMVELAPHDVQICDVTLDNAQRTPLIWQQAIERGQAEGQISTEYDAHALANYLFTTLVGMRVLAKSNPDPLLLQDIAKMALSILG